MKKIKDIEKMNLDELLRLESKTFIFSKTDINKLLYFLPLILLSNNVTFNIPILSNIINQNYDDYRNNSPIRKELIRLYNILLNDLVVEISKLSISNDPICISMLIGDYLIPKGILSYIDKFYVTNSSLFFKSERDYYETFDLEGLYVICGYGCCRHINSFISDLLNTMGIKSDKLACIYGDKQLLNNRINEVNFLANHLITGYIYNNYYYLIDAYNSRYSYTECDNYYLDSYLHNGIIPFFDKNLYQKELYWNHDIPVYLNNEKEITEKKEKVFNCFYNECLDVFTNFKKEHFEIYEKIAYLAPLDLNRTCEKEYEKLKKLR